MTQFDFSTDAIARLAQLDAARALAEDVGSGDLTAALVDPARRVRARVLLRESAVLCGQPWAQAALHALALPPPPTGHHASTAFTAREAEPQPLYLLSDRQLRVLSELARGKTSREIAQQLGIEESTVRTHLNVIYQRLDVKNKTQASSMYWRWSHALGMPND
jgi:nicotinate-nucleotide pyrophosphorylase (carboxylating)